MSTWYIVNSQKRDSFHNTYYATRRAHHNKLIWHMLYMQLGLMRSLVVYTTERSITVYMHPCLAWVHILYILLYHNKVIWHVFAWLCCINVMRCIYITVVCTTVASVYFVLLLYVVCSPQCRCKEKKSPTPPAPPRPPCHMYILQPSRPRWTLRGYIHSSINLQNTKHSFLT